jgi:hydroxymethylglutaryl-CoA lyase
VPGKKLSLPKRVQIGDITVRDGLQPLEHFFPTDQKVALAEELILAGFKDLEVTNFGHPKFLPQFKDVEQVLDRLFQSERVGSMLKQNGGDVEIHVVTINEKAVDRAIEFKANRGYGPDYVLQMVSTDENHHRVNAGNSVAEYLEMSGRCIEKAHAAGMKFCGTVSTIWGSPMRGSRGTMLEKGVEYSKAYLDLGADYIEQADHDGSADPQRVYEYFTMILDPEYMGKWADPKYHLAHFHTSRGMGLANYLAALQAGVTMFETTVSSQGGQPANKMDGVYIGGTGNYYHESHLLSGLVSTEDFVVMCEAMGIDTGIDIPKLLALGKRFVSDYLDISPADKARMLANVSEFTGIATERLAKLGDDASEIDVLKAEAAAHAAFDGDENPDGTARRAHAAVDTVRMYLRMGRWSFARSESIVAGPPPSPHLAHLFE